MGKVNRKLKTKTTKPDQLVDQHNKEEGERGRKEVGKQNFFNETSRVSGW